MAALSGWQSTVNLVRRRQPSRDTQLAESVKSPSALLLKKENRLFITCRGEFVPRKSGVWTARLEGVEEDEGVLRRGIRLGESVEVDVRILGRMTTCQRPAIGEERPSNGKQE
jgi:hypothetical protein